MSNLKISKKERLNWDETFMNLALVVSKRSACRYHEIGAVFVDQYKRIISMGYNGPTEGDIHGVDVGCAKVDGDPETGKIRKCRGAHAEINGIINSQDTTRLRGATLYTVSSPCYDCMKALNNAGIKEVVYYDKYKRIKSGGDGVEQEDDEVWDLAKKRGIVIRKFEGKNIINA